MTEKLWELLYLLKLCTTLKQNHEQHVSYCITLLHDSLKTKEQERFSFWETVIPV